MAKTIYLMRHGRDDPVGGALDEVGRAQVLASAGRLKADLGSIDSVTVYHSPLRRARESAEILAEVLRPINTQLVERPELGLGRFLVEEVAREIDSVGIIISHGPDLEAYAETLANRDVYFGNAWFHRFKI